MTDIPIRKKRLDKCLHKIDCQDTAQNKTRLLYIWIKSKHINMSESHEIVKYISYDIIDELESTED